MAFARGSPADLICRASGFPAVRFTWFIKRPRPDEKMEILGIKHRDRGETVLEPEQVFGSRYRSATYDSILEIDNIRTEHYTTLFRCEAENEYGATSHDIEVI